jgi:hypothetical protein
MLIIGTTGTSLFGYRGNMLVNREVQIDDCRDKQAQKENARLREENERLRRADRNANAHAQIQVVHVRNNEPRFELVSQADLIALKYISVGFLLAWLILRK